MGWTCRPRPWVILPQEASDDADVTLGYLARYTRRVAIDNRRILELDVRHGIITFGYRKNDAGPHGEDIQNTRTITTVEFIDRYLLHVMPKHFSRTQFYGCWASRNKKKQLPQIRAQLGAQAADPSAVSADAPDDTLPEEMEEVLRRKCPQSGELTPQKTFHVPPPMYDPRAIVLCPQQRKTSLEQQALLPGMATWLPGGAAFRARLYGQWPATPTSGFT